MFKRLTKQMAEKQGVTEELKVTDMMALVRQMKNIQSHTEIIGNNELIYV